MRDIDEVLGFEREGRMSVDVALCEDLRRRIKVIADEMNEVRRRERRAKHGTGRQAASDSEAIGNFTLAFRHLEDASMRLGKAIQVLDGGVSVYDKEQVPVSGGG